MGSGKTTAIIQAVSYLSQQGKKVGVITNDQGDQQVDTNFFRLHHISVEEVSGGCFCCNLPDLNRTIEALKIDGMPDAIFAESVGSCTDLIATVVNPLLYADSKMEIVLSIFADVELLLYWLMGDEKIFHENINYIYEKQLQEADILVVNKIDLLKTRELKRAKKLIEQYFGHRKILYQNSLDQESVATWTQTIIDHFSTPALKKSLEIDYERYGAGEAEMAWLDVEIGILTSDLDAVETGLIFVEKVYKRITDNGYSIGHLKFLLNDGKQQRKISYTAIKQPKIKQHYKRVKRDRVVILINARVQTEPVFLRKIISDVADELEISTGCKIIENKLSYFKPGYPKPSQRIPVFESAGNTDQ